MRKFLSLLTVTFVVALATACVTINVYFPEAQAEEAADKFIGGVWGDESVQATEDEPQPPLDNPQSALARSPGLWLLEAIVPAAHAQADISISTPAIESIQSRMKQRFDNSLRGYFESGAIGLTNNALVKVRDLSAVPLSERSKLNQLVAEENADRKAVYREIAVANGHPEWEDRIRDTFARKWVEEARSGWWYQNDGGEWVQK